LRRFLLSSPQKTEGNVTDKEFEFQVLLKELDHADKQISAFMDLQMKILGVVFTILAASLGLLLSTAPDKALTPHNLAKLLVVISAVGSFGVIQSTINYGIALGYMHNKLHFIAPRLQRLIGLAQPPLQAVTAFQESPARVPVLLATLGLAAGIFALNGGVLWSAWDLVAKNSLTQMLVMGAVLLIIFAAMCQFMTWRAMKRIGIVPESDGASLQTTAPRDSATA
jgi:hypothetical protein